MPTQTACPNCKQTLQVPDEYVGRAVACPTCQHVFNTGGEAPAPPPAPVMPNLELGEERPAPAPPPRRDPDEDRRRDRDEDRRRDYDRDDRRRDRRDDDDYDRPRRRRREEYDDYDRGSSYWGGKADSAHTLGLLSCILCIFPIVGLILGIIALTNASSSLSRMYDEGSRDFAAKQRLQTAKSMGLTGLIISSVLIVVCCSFNFLVGMSAPMRFR